MTLPENPQRLWKVFTGVWNNFPSDLVSDVVFVVRTKKTRKKRKVGTPG